MFDLDRITRANVKKLVPYSSARDEFKEAGEVWLDANENCLPTNYNRYPDPHQEELKEAIATLKQVQPAQILLGNGSDEAIDLLYRAFCIPGQDKALILPPTYGMYEVAAAINDIEVLRVPLDDNFQPDLDRIQPLLNDEHLKLIFLCSPNNPTGNVMDIEFVKRLAAGFHGLVVVDEAYIDLAPQYSTLSQIATIPNLLVLQTFSKAWGLAGLRLGMAFANEGIINILKKIKPPYNINTYSQQQALATLREKDEVEAYRNLISAQREKLSIALENLSYVKQVYPSQANFILVAMDNPDYTYKYLLGKGIVVRNRSKVVVGCLRITIGTAEENNILIEALKELEA